MMFRMDMDIEVDDSEDYNEELCFTPQSPTTLEYELIPIDHGYTLPSTIGLTDLWFEWLKWPQAKIPFGVEELRYIERLNADADVAILKHKFGELIGNDCFKVLRITTLWLKVASRAGLTPYAIGNAICRRSREVPSALEKMAQEAQQLVDADGGVDVDVQGAGVGITCDDSTTHKDEDKKEGTDKGILTGHQSAMELLFFEKLTHVMERYAHEQLTGSSSCSSSSRSASRSDFKPIALLP